MEPAQPDIIWDDDLDRRVANAGEPTPDDVMRLPAGVRLETQQDHDAFIEATLMGFASD